MSDVKGIRIKIYKRMSRMERKMGFDEFLSFRDVKIRDMNHERIVRMFYPYLQSVCGFADALPKIISKIFSIDLTEESITTGCFNGMTDNTSAPYGNPDFYMKFSNGVRVYVYGTRVKGELASLDNCEYVLFALADNMSNNIERMADRHFYMKE